MAVAKYKIVRKCPVCGEEFFARTLDTFNSAEGNEETADKFIEKNGHSISDGKEEA